MSRNSFSQSQFQNKSNEKLTKLEEATPTNLNNLRSKSCIRSLSRRSLNNNVKLSDRRIRSVNRDIFVLDPLNLVVKGNSKPTTPTQRTSQYLLVDDLLQDRYSGPQPESNERSTSDCKKSSLNTSGNLQQKHFSADIPERNDRKLSIGDVLNYIAYINKQHFK